MTWLGLIPLTLAVCVLAGAIWQAWSERRDRRRFPAPGSFVQGVHVNCAGAGTPVLLEAGVAASSVGWALVQRQLRSDCKVCATDRPGFGWSSPSKLARTPQNFVLEMDLVLRHIGVPAVLVGHSFGGLLVQLYTARHPENVLGLVLVDPPHLSEWCDPAPFHRARLQRGAGLARRGAWLVRTGFVRLALVLLARGSPKASKAFAAASSGRAGRGYLEGLVGQVGKLPRELWPVLQAHWCRASGFVSIADHLESLPVVAAGVREVVLPPDLPVTVISGAHLSPELKEEHALIAARSHAGRHLVAEGAGHWVHVDAPAVVAHAVREMLARVARNAR